MENQRGISYEKLFGNYLKDAKHITITDPYIRIFYQARNLMELLEVIVKQKSEEDEVVVSLVTVEDEFKGDQQREFFMEMQNSVLGAGIKFAWSFDTTGSQHARHIVTDTGWKISLDRGLDIFQQYNMNDAFQLSNRLQQHRACKAFEITYIKT
jgi:ATP-dependent Lon protease